MMADDSDGVELKIKHFHIIIQNPFKNPICKKTRGLDLG